MENNTKTKGWQNTPGRIRTFGQRIRKAFLWLNHRIGHRLYSFIQVVSFGWPVV
jgi:hypothetical protein